LLGFGAYARALACRSIDLHGHSVSYENFNSTALPAEKYLGDNYTGGGTAQRRRLCVSKQCPV
jgi:hypothetical protein